MSGFTNRKNWLSGLLTVSLAVIPTCTITAEENSKIVDQYIIVELEPVRIGHSRECVRNGAVNRRNG